MQNAANLLRASGEKGLSPGAISKGLSKPSRASLEEALAALNAVNVGTPKTPRYVLPEFDRRLENACDRILARATPGRATVFTAAALRKGIKKPWGDHGITELTERRELFLIEPGSSKRYLHARSVAPLLSNVLSAALEPEAVRKAYAVLVQRGGFADVPICRLAAESGAPLAALKTWLAQESRAGRAMPTRGDWSLADTIAREAAMEVRGEPHLQIRLL